jgi:hypothetical protein
LGSGDTIFYTWDKGKILKGIDEIEKAAKRVLEGKPEKGDEKKLLQSTVSVPRREYKGLIKLCIQLARMAQKQLDGVKFDKKETKLIEDFGKVLGKLHFYGGNSYHVPKDDMPVVATAFTNPLRGKILLSGIGRARCIEIVIKDPATGKLVLCSGGITLYHEYVSSSPMSDEKWREILKKKDGPKPATWLEKYMAKPSKPKDK